jgi:outer membrane protein OmpA-like peptidoglycan-associated protein
MIALATVLYLQSAAVASAEKVKKKGLIVGRTGDTITLKTSQGENLTVEINDATRVEEPKGMFKMRSKEMSFTALMPGLRVEVEGISDVKDRLVADKIKFSKDDLKMAEAMQAGLVPTQQAVQANQQGIATNKENIATNKEGIAQNQQNIEANRQQIAENDKEVSDRFSALTDFETKDSANVYFASGSTKISPKDKVALKQMADEAANLKGYIIEVKGYADSSGNPSMNQRLSMDRAQEVVAYLLQACNVPARRVVAPGAMGETNPAAPNETSKGRAENRRVEVKLLVNRGLASGG